MPKQTNIFARDDLLEKDIEAVGMKFAQRRGWFEVKIERTSKRGFPDRFMARKGRVILVEWKRNGEEPTTQQLKRHAELRAAGVEVFWFDNLEDAYRVFY